MHCLFKSLFAASFLLICIIDITLADTLSAASPFASDEHRVWRRAPIRITLPVGRERFVTFPETMTFGYDKNQLPASILRVENDNKTLYLLAKKPFATQRTQAKLRSGVVVLLDISAVPQADDHPIDIMLPKAPDNTHQTPGKAAIVNKVTVMRYAIQQLYAPKRLLTTSPFIIRFPVSTLAVPLLRDDSILDTS